MQEQYTFFYSKHIRVSLVCNHTQYVPASHPGELLTVGGILHTV